MARLTEDLLTLARVESGETRFDTEPVPPIELLHDAEESFREIARSQGVELQIIESQIIELRAKVITARAQPSNPCRPCWPIAKPSIRFFPT